VVDTSEEENCGTILSNTNVVDTEASNTGKPQPSDTGKPQPSDTAEELTDVSDQPEKCDNEHKKLSDVALPEIGFKDGLPKDSMGDKTSQPTINNEAVMVVEITSEQPEVVADRVSEDKKPCFIDAATQIEVPDNKTTLITAANITSDPLVPALLDELSALK